MQDLNKALSQIGDIRAQLASHSLFRGFGPLVIALTGGLALAVASVQSLWPATFAANNPSYVTCWLLLAALTVVLIGAEMLARTKRLHDGLANAMLNTVIEPLLPAAIAGIAVTVVLMKFTDHTHWMLPGLWQLFVSLGIFAAARNLPRATVLVAAWYFVCGIIVLAVCAQQRELAPWHMGIPFTIGQLTTAVILKSAYGRET